VAKRAFFSGQITDDQMNSGESYRVRFSYGIFSIAPKVTQSGTYYYAVKRHKGRLFKVYVGKCGEVTHDLLHQATMVLLNKAYVATGQWYMRDHRGREPQKLPKGA
jgi:hypothetical protein